ncbi:hypothetical protein Psta_4157 [Pirellula staleyi DSM 6068]|uniref:Uncharacterized protein n=1 Tax=Pirellula staleyi (strain ATCC 27377 / DSM 6068 / ICPB 4128) TaxID=530564 RepID=D2R3V7_PIRSD|nr:hypothetical protein [Pirellula staleyi]ADB18806.1 hypothetical protein Psta_4157 [Pirellula staleyi DSM 6068]
MRFDFDALVEVLRLAVLSAISDRDVTIRELSRIEPLWAVSLDILPWQPYVGIAFRLESESDYGASSNSADWKHSHFIENISSAPLSVAADYVHRLHQEFNEDVSLEVSHLILLAGAHALLDSRVALLLRSIGIDAPEINERLSGTYFKYFVIDSDGTIKANYCDIVRANRATRFMLGRIA